jgi:hypothetical protein
MKRFLSLSRPRSQSLTLQFRALRTESVLTAPGTAILLALTVIGAIAALVTETYGYLLHGSWMYIIVSGTLAVAAKMGLDYYDRSGDAALWRVLLAERFQTQSVADPEVTRLTALAIDMRSRLADAEARADDGARALVAETMPALDAWIDGIARLANRLGEMRFEGEFQSGLAETSAKRLKQIEAQLKSPTTTVLNRQLAQTAEGLRQQIAAAKRFRNVSDAGYLRLEHAVATLGTIGSQVMLVLTRGSEFRGPHAIGAQIGHEVASLESLIRALDRASDGPDDSLETAEDELVPSLHGQALPQAL